MFFGSEQTHGADSAAALAAAVAAGRRAPVAAGRRAPGAQRGGGSMSLFLYYSLLQDLENSPGNVFKSIDQMKTRRGGGKKRGRDTGTSFFQMKMFLLKHPDGKNKLKSRKKGKGKGQATGLFFAAA